MIGADDPAYDEAREIEEREAAAKASCIVRDVHLELADEYAARAEAGRAGSTKSTTDDQTDVQAPR